MKKTITINLAGVVFHIEEDAYEVLQQYLDSVKRYFSKVEGGADIQGDIEARIAEIFSESISESKQAITLEEVSHVIRQLGSVEDMVGEEVETDESFTQQQRAENQQQTTEDDGPKRLYRDVTNQIVGGVCSGIAVYFEVNPLWIRIAYVGLFFGISILPPFGGVLFLTYIILWIAMPAKANLENTGKFKRFFRSKKDKVVGGVASGIASYSGIDPVIIRIIFLVTMFAGGAGLITYLIVWAITPEAQSVTDELQMQGDPITLNNIEEQIRKNVKMDDKVKEKTVVRVLSFPFKVIAMVVAALGPFVRFLFDALRVFVAILLFIIGGVMLFAVLAVAGVGLGIINADMYNIQTGDFPLGQFAAEISPWMVAFPTMAALVPVITILLVSLSLMARRVLLGPILGLVFIGLFVIGVIGSVATILPVANKFKEEGYSIEKTNFVIPYSTFQVNLNRVDGDNNNFYPVELQIVGWDGSQVQLSKRMEAQGETYTKASAFAKSIQYNVALQDSTLIFDSGLTIPESEPYRAQRMKMKLYVPYGQPFTMSPEIGRLLHNTLHPNGYSENDLEGNVWKFDEKEGLKCLTCKTKQDEESNEEAPEAPEEPNANHHNHQDNEDDWD